MKNNTNIPQSKVLATILPLRSADMGWNVFVDGSTRLLPIEDWDLIKDGNGKVKFYPCWSLTALFDVLPKYIGDYGKCLYYDVGKFYCGYMDDGDFMTSVEETSADNPIDACYEMIVKLHEKNLL